MASIEFINKRIDSANTRIASLEKKIKRINDAKASGWKINPYYYTEYDLNSAIRELEDAKNSLEKYNNMLEIETEKQGSRDVQVIIDFLDKWKERVFEYFEDGFKELKALGDECREYYSQSCNYKLSQAERDDAKEKYTAVNNKYKSLLYGTYVDELAHSYDGRPYTVSRKVESGRLEYLLPYKKNTYDESIQYVKKCLDEEAKRKYDFIIERTNKIVGKIEDASNLRIGAKDDLNGYIIGTRGVAKVQTIGAGGYNEDSIVNVKHGQRFHFRTLINPVK